MEKRRKPMMLGKRKKNAARCSARLILDNFIRDIL
jgi:hypothetical protein